MVWLAHKEIKRSTFSHSSYVQLNVFVAGSIHQGPERLSDKSRERQCSFMCFSALLCAQTLLIESWNSATVDQILFEGDKMYLKCL